MAKVITVKLFTPMPYMRTPEALLPEKVKKSYALEQTWVLGKGLVHGMEDNDVPVPAGKWTEDKQDYELQGPMDLAEIQKFCKKFYPDEPRCLQQGMMLHTLPLAADEVTLEPVPEDIEAQDIVLDVSDIVDPEVIDVEYERAFVKGHRLKGYPVFVPIFGQGKIDQQINVPFGWGTAGEKKAANIFYRVMADKPMPFDKYARAVGASTTPMTFKEWQERFVAGQGRGSGTFPVMAPELRDKLDAGGKVSRAEVLFRDLFDRGCIDLNNNVICHTFPSDAVTVRTPKKDMVVQIREHSHEPGGWPGRIVGTR